MPFITKGMAMEPMAATIRAHPSIHGYLQIMTYKASLFADNLLLTISQPSISLPNVMNLLHRFEVVSALRVNGFNIQ